MTAKKVIKNLQVKVTYTVGLGDIEVSEEVFDQLNEIVGDGFGRVDATTDHVEAFDWLGDNIKEADAFDWEYEIEEIEGEEE